MQGSRGRDLGVGIFVLIGLLAVAYLSIQVGGLSYAAAGGLTLRAGAEEDPLVSGDELSFTVGAFNIEKLVGTLVHNIQIGGSE
jgi:hypothetical protein